jgi:hypothetical protein
MFHVSHHQLNAKKILLAHECNRIILLMGMEKDSGLELKLPSSKH